MFRSFQSLICGLLVALLALASLHCEVGEDAHCTSETECAGPCACHLTAPPPPPGSIVRGQPSERHVVFQTCRPQRLLPSDIFRPPTASC